MQNRYVGDVGDFGKYGLLRALVGLPARQDLSLGVVWYLTSPAHTRERANADGKHTGYLDRPDLYRDCDSTLFAALQSIVGRRRRAVHEIGRCGVLGDCAFHAQELTPRSDRANWLRQAIERVHDRDVVFLDPDNGLRLGGEAGAPSLKHAQEEEVAAFLQLGHAVVVYHHLDRRAGGHDARIRGLLADADHALSTKARPFALRLRRGSSRAFVVLTHRPELAARLRRRAAAFLATGWRQHFSPEIYAAQ